MKKGSDKLPVKINPKSSLEVSTQVAEQIKLLIALDELPVGTSLPPVTVLARQLNINHNTVAAVYNQLAESGYLFAQRGKGTFVADTVSTRNLIKNNEYYHLLRHAFELANSFGVSTSEFAGAAYAQATLSSTKWVEQIELIFVEEDSERGLELYNILIKELDFPISFISWKDVEAKEPEVWTNLISTQLIVTTSIYAVCLGEIHELSTEIFIVDFKPNLEILSQIFSLPKYSRVALVGSDSQELNWVRKTLISSGFAQDSWELLNVQYSSDFLKTISQYNLVLVSKAINSLLPNRFRKKNSNLHIFNCYIDPTNLLVLKARIRAVYGT